jgi:hypothetical protein
MTLKLQCYNIKTKRNKLLYKCLLIATEPTLTFQNTGDQKNVYYSQIQLNDYGMTKNFPMMWI